MSLTQEQVKHIANLSRLQLSDEDVAKYLKDLNSIVDYVDVLSKADENELKNVWDLDGECLMPRVDEVYREKISTREELLACSNKNIINHSIAINNIM